MTAELDERDEIDDDEEARADAARARSEEILSRQPTLEQLRDDEARRERLKFADDETRRVSGMTLDALEREWLNNGHMSDIARRRLDHLWAEKAAAKSAPAPVSQEAAPDDMTRRAPEAIPADKLREAIRQDIEYENGRILVAGVNARWMAGERVSDEEARAAFAFDAKAAFHQIFDRIEGEKNWRDGVCVAVVALLNEQSSARMTNYLRRMEQSDRIAALEAIVAALPKPRHRVQAQSRQAQ